MKFTIKKKYKLTFFIIISIILFITSLLAGANFFSPIEAINAFSSDSSSVDFTILYKLRLSRILLALVMGASLAVSGTLFQALLKNPLADPYLIGVSSGAALGVTIAIVLSLPYILIVLFAFIGCILTVTGVYMISRKMRFGTTSLILSGVALSFILSSSVLLLYSISKAEKVHKAVMWMMGDLSIGRYDMLLQLSICAVLLIIATLFYHKHLNIISFGEHFSQSLGITNNNMRAIFWIASLLSALSVSLCGVIGFVGLIIPHIMRNIFGPKHLTLIPLTAWGGAIFLMTSDTIGRTIAPPYEIPVGIITSISGGIFFLFFILKRRGIE